MLGLLFLIASAAAQPASSIDDLPCAAGAMIHFEPGSDQILGYAVHRLEVLAAGARNESLLDEIVRIESGGDEGGAGFDSGLSRRRSAAIADFLAARGFTRGKMIIVVGDIYGRADLVTRAEDRYLFRQAWVSLRISREDYARRFPPPLIRECF